MTKTDVRDQFLLTDEELRDGNVLPSVSIPNPRKSTWSNMQLYLREQVVEFAVKKWGSLEAIEQEIQKRSIQLQSRKEKKFKARITGKFLKPIQYCHN